MSSLLTDKLEKSEKYFFFNEDLEEGSNFERYKEQEEREEQKEKVEENERLKREKRGMRGEWK